MPTWTLSVSPAAETALPAVDVTVEAQPHATVADLARALGGQAPQEHKAVTLVAPEMAENGGAVPMQLACSLPGLRRLAVMVEKNPVPLAALFEFGEGAETNVNTRLKMAQTSAVYVVALMADGRVFYTQREIKVTLGGCGS